MLRAPCKKSATLAQAGSKAPSRVTKPKSAKAAALPKGETPTKGKKPAPTKRKAPATRAAMRKRNVAVKQAASGPAVPLGLPEMEGAPALASVRRAPLLRSQCVTTP